MSFDPKVWTSDVPKDRCVWVNWNGQQHMAIVRVFDEYPDDADISYPGTLASWKVASKHGAVRSILPVASAAEHAALVACELEMRDAVAGAPVVDPGRYEGDNHGDSFSSGWDNGEFFLAKKLRAALARLDAARKGRGA